MKRIVVAFGLAFTLLLVVGVIASAQEVPPPYAGQKNPFPWDDVGAQEAGKKLYQQGCLGCHGVKGDSVAASNFASPAYVTRLQGKADLVYWALSEGRIDKGMPPYKGSLSETQRWQVMNYMWSLGKQSGAVKPTAPTSAEGLTLQLLPAEAIQSGKMTSLAAALKDAKGNPVESATVKFYVNEDFFGKGQMLLGDATTGKDGVARLDTTLVTEGEVKLVAEFLTLKAETGLNVAPANHPYYQTEIGLKLPTIGSNVFARGVVSEGLGDVANAPGSTLQMPGGVLSWLLLPIGGVLAIWLTYFLVMREVLHITPRGKTAEHHSRALPYALMVAVAVIGLALAVKIATGPYSQFHLW